VTRIIHDIQKPNGIVLSPDLKTLYVADSNPRGNQHLLAFPLREDGSVGPKCLLHDFGKSRGIDGMCVDVHGNIYGAAGSGPEGAFTSSTRRASSWLSSRLPRRQPIVSSATAIARLST
jgi:sugar lactone lactonase YvrE